MRKTITRLLLAKIEDAVERDLLFAALDRKYGMWSESFCVEEDGRIYAKPEWWRKRKIFNRNAQAEVGAFCNGWVSGRHTASPRKNAGRKIRR